MNIWFTLFHPFVVILLINLIVCSILCGDLTTPFTAWLCHVKADWKCEKCEKCKNSREIGFSMYDKPTIWTDLEMIHIWLKSLCFSKDRL